MINADIRTATIFCVYQIFNKKMRQDSNYSWVTALFFYTYYTKVKNKHSTPIEKILCSSVLTNTKIKS